ncbi:MAG: type II toxin-antitoxin system HicB family antitoxin [Dehalococcoidia bacterium]|nr:type II toxin-antitoxin system HicB family antitoxin [Dehalococcoidia bacterium]
MYYQVPVKIDKQEDGLWRVEAPSLQGCFVDAPTLADALRQIQEVIAMCLDIDEEEGRPLPPDVQMGEALPMSAVISVIPDEIEFYRVLPNGQRVTASAAAREKAAKGGSKQGRKKRAA